VAERAETNHRKSILDSGLDLCAWDTPLYKTEADIAPDVKVGKESI
jgi:hypothetical protein